MNTSMIFNLNWLDYIFIGVIGISALISLIRGFVREALSLAIWILAIWLAFNFASLLSVYFEPYIHTPSLRFIACFATVVLVTLIVGTIACHLIVKLINVTGLSGTDRLLGLIFGVARGVLLVAVMILVLQLTSLTRNDWWKESQLAPEFQGVVKWLHNFVPDQVRTLSSIIAEQRG